MSKKPKASRNLAKDVQRPRPPKLKRIDIPNGAKAEILGMEQNLNRYLAGVVAGLGIKRPWNLDRQRMQIVVEDKEDKLAKSLGDTSNGKPK